MHRLQHTKFLGDRDSSSFMRAAEHEPYREGVGINKLECVDDLQKRCGSCLQRLKHENKKSKLADEKGLSGAGRLADKSIDKL